MRAIFLNKNEVSKEEYVLDLLKKGIWLYFFLLIFEGALRKWFLPFLSTPLLIVRDPIAVWLIYLSWKYNLLKSNPYILSIIFLCLLSVCTALIFGHGSVPVAIFGARILLLHFPLMFVIGKIFTEEDVITLGKAVLIISIPMAILVALQFYSPQSAWVNRGVGGDLGGAGFNGGALGYFRPPATFSFINGNVLFFSFAACYVFYFWLSKANINRFILLGATFALLISTPLSISRSLLFSIILTFLFAFLTVVGNPKFLVKILLFSISLVLILVVLSSADFFKTAAEVFTVRFELASNHEGDISSTILDRFFGGLVSAFTQNTNDLPFFGYGIGMGTNAGAVLLTGSNDTFLVAEGEWLRLVGEMGFVMGIILVVIRLIFCLDLAYKSFRSLKSGNILSWLLLSFGFLTILQIQWSQPTSLGFSTLIGGLILASAKES